MAGKPSAQSRTHGSEPERFLTFSNRLTVEALVRGMEDVERIEAWLEYEVRNQSRKDVIGLLNRRKMELEG